MYHLPSSKNKHLKKDFKAIFGNGLVLSLVFVALLLLLATLYLRIISLDNIARHIQSLIGVEKRQSLTLPENLEPTGEYISRNGYEQAIIDAVKEASPSVVSIVISKNLPVFGEEFINPFGENSPFEILIPKQVQKGTKYQEVGAGSGFIVSNDGLVLTNKHVVSDKKADYTVITSDAKKYTAKVIALDPVQDVAIIKIQASVDKSPLPESFKTIKLGDSSGIQIGQGAIAIGNALGQFSNTVSVGVVSGLGRTVQAGDQAGSFSETLEDIIQTDAAINSGNSGGPLINLNGEVIGINTAMAEGAQSIGFAIPVNVAKRDLEQILATNKITYPFLGVRYILVDAAAKKEYGLSVDYGAYVLRGDNGEVAITRDSAAQKAGIKEKDVILEFDGKRITAQSSMSKIIQTYKPGDTVLLKILRDGKEMELGVTLGER